LGASSIGYTPLPARWVFREKSVLHHNAIILAMPMDKPRIDTAPSLDAMFAVMEAYRDLGQIANQAADYLRERGFSAHAGHPLMGLALYPPLAQAAGLGWLASSGLIITPEHGPCVRLAAVFTSIENLPYAEHTDHAWVEDYCASCGLCIKKCPAEAIYTKPIRHENGQITHVDNDKCFPYFHHNYGCSVCVAVCPFNHVPFDKLKANMRHDPAFEIG
jgi:epoxyqueuosine reductase QueG